jgi:pimeloyl-ACP methyl ester carboxylesterase
MRFVALGLCLLLSACAAPRTVPFDPARDDATRHAAHPARNQQVLVPSGGVGMNAVLMLAAGEGAKPTVLLLHGLPGNEQNLDLAQAIRRAGWNVLTMHYRGSWGSPGTFSIANAAQDASAAMAFLREPGTVEKFGIDPRRLVLAGHSMGGFAAALHAAHDDEVAGLVLLDAWNVGAEGDSLRADPSTQAAFEASFDDLGNSLSGADAKSLAHEVAAGGDGWNLEALAPALAKLPVLLVWADHGIAEQNAALAAAITRAGSSRLATRHFPTDHAFADHRIALAQAVVAWLRARE